MDNNSGHSPEYLKSELEKVKTTSLLEAVEQCLVSTTQEQLGWAKWDLSKLDQEIPNQFQFNDHLTPKNVPVASVKKRMIQK